MVLLFHAQGREVLMDSDIRYRASPDFMLRQIAGESILVPTGAAAAHFNGLISLNDTGVFLWNALQQSRSEAELVALVLQEYEVESDTAAADVSAFLARMGEAGLLISEGFA